jgi:hypothetical protein
MIYSIELLPLVTNQHMTQNIAHEVNNVTKKGHYMIECID